MKSFSTYLHINRQALTHLVCGGAVLLTALGVSPFSTTAQAQELLSVVPAESSYVIRFQGSRDSIDMGFISPNSDFMKQMMGAFKKNIQKAKPQEQRAMKLIEELVTLYQNDQFEQIGLNTKTIQIGVYGLGLWPVASVSLSDQGRFRSWMT